jgi:hypothetical protein
MPSGVSVSTNPVNRSPSAFQPSAVVMRPVLAITMYFEPRT